MDYGVVKDLIRLMDLKYTEVRGCFCPSVARQERQRRS